MTETADKKQITNAVANEMSALRVSNGRPSAIIPGLEDTPELMAQKTLLNLLAFKVPVKDGNNVYVYPDFNGDGELTRQELENLLTHPQLAGRWPDGKEDEIRAMLDSGNTAAILSKNTESRQLGYNPKVTNTTRFEKKPNERVDSALARQVYNNFDYIEAVVDPNIGKRYVKIDQNNDDKRTVKEIRDLRLSPAMEGHWSDATRARIESNEINGTRVFFVEEMRFYELAKKAMEGWPTDVKEKVLPVLNGTGVIDKEIQKKLDREFEQRENNLEMLPEIREWINKSRSNDGLIASQMYRFDYMLNECVRKGKITPEQKDEIRDTAKLLDEVRIILRVEGNIKERLEAPVAEPILNLTHSELKQSLKRFKNATPQMMPADDPEPVSRFEEFGKNPAGFTPLIVQGVAPASEKIETPEQEMARRLFDEMTLIPVAGKIVNLDSDGNKALTNLEASRNLNDPNMQRYLTREQKESLREMVNLGLPDVETLERLEAFMKTPIVNGANDEATKKFIELRDVDKDAKVSIGEALKFNEKQKTLASVPAKSQ